MLRFYNMVIQNRLLKVLISAEFRKNRDPLKFPKLNDLIKEYNIDYKGDNFDLFIENLYKLWNESMIAPRVNFKYIVKTYDAAFRKDSVVFLMDHISRYNLRTLFSDGLGKPLLTHPAPLNIAKRIVLEVSKGVDYLHRQGIYHRDLKVDNVVPTQEFIDFLTDVSRKKYSFSQLDEVMGDSPVVKIVDLGTVKKGRGEFTNTYCGSYMYVPPEVSKGHYKGKPYDMWQVGAIFYELLTGNKPRAFSAQEKSPEGYEGCYRVIAELLKHDPDKRMTTRQLLSHSLFRKSSIKKRCNAKSPIKLSNKRSVKLKKKRWLKQMFKSLFNMRFRRKHGKKNLARIGES